MAAGPSRDDPRPIAVVPAESALRSRVSHLAAPIAGRVDARVRQASGFWTRFRTLKPVRVYLNFSYNDGNLMAAGMSYQTLFAVFAGVWVGFSIAGLWLKSVPGLESELITLINNAIPNLISPDGLIPPSALPTGFSFGWTGVVAILALLWTAIAWLFYTRQAVRAMFGLGRDRTGYLLQKARDLVLALAFGVILIAASGVSFLSTEATEVLLGFAGLQRDSVLITVSGHIAGFVISLALNLVVLAAMFRLLSRVAIPWRALISGSFLGSVALSAVSAVAGLIVGATHRNPLLATFAVFIGLLIWFVLICRIMLLSASWIAVGMADRNISPRTLTPAQAAAERAAAERSARVIVARADAAAAEAELAAARGLRRLGARRRAEKARRRLDDLLDSAADPGAR